ncbi:hypothetical protein [Lysobacter sp. CA196]|uniref:hypothetical protein n=1 Tax=Lysobacter sp. CA196 TaxID=3455606 RepID=UPI003F8D067F
MIAASPLADATQAPADYIYTSAGDFAEQQRYLARPDIAGVQIVYHWKQLEREQGEYDFDRIDADLKQVQSLGKKLFIQIQDRFFEARARNIPAYLLTDPIYGGGLVPQLDNPGENQPQASGWATQQWNPAVRERFQKLLQALAKRYDGRIEGINLPETAIDIDDKHDRSGFSCDKYFAAEMENLAAARMAFKKSHVVQYVNFWPCEWNNDHDYMGRLFAYAAKHGVGLGGPDIVPFKPGQMKNSYPFFHRYRAKLPLIAMAIQEPTLTYTDQKTGKPFTREEFTAFAEDYLGADIIFWATSSPWLNR